TPSGGLFTWNTLVSHIGEHEFTFSIRSDLGVSTQSVVVEVAPPEDAAPVFIRPSRGQTFDLARSPCIETDVEVRDEDSSRVDISLRDGPQNASITETGPKSAVFQWCPTQDQIDTSQRWTVTFEAGDGDHDVTVWEYVVVLRVPGRENCPGAPPVVTIESPQPSQIVRSSTGYRVRLNVSDDMGLRDAPLVYYAKSAPEDFERPDVTLFEQIEAVQEHGAWVARIPSLGLADGQRFSLYVLGAAIDNDDPSGTACDHRTETPVLTFVAEGGDPFEATLENCEVCDRSSDCNSGLCVVTGGEGRCAESCSGSCSGGSQCQSYPSDGGVLVSACGPISTLCGLDNDSCQNDGNEPNDTQTTAGDINTHAEGRICPSDADYYRASIGSGVTLNVDLSWQDTGADLDLFLINEGGQFLASSARANSNTESVTYTAIEGMTTYVKVVGFQADVANYELNLRRTQGPVCQDDEFEQNDTIAQATPIGIDELVYAQVCFADNDYFSFQLQSPATVDILLLFEHQEADLDLLLTTANGAQLATSETTDDNEEIVTSLAAGQYIVRVRAYDERSAEYLLEIGAEAGDSCVLTSECPSGTYCEASLCQDAACTNSAQCAAMHICPVQDARGGETLCSDSSCELNRDCRSGETCKKGLSGRFCGRTGNGRNGDSCESFEDCGGQRTCMPWQNGYCARVECLDSSDCESGTYCVEVDNVNVCVLDCEDDDSLCREAEGYVCEFVYPVDALDSEDFRLTCIPGN
ncbi:MAG: pre-peptidase C-terminal domain-containing protein, partial [Myxococcales bacterium]|nr:pre-peptidase C-terminal domain-containing protein [Myxococcales bacterium]